MSNYKSSNASLFASLARSVKEKCPHCGEEFTLGVNGTKDGCDDCTGTERAVNGYALQTECWCFEIIGDNDDCPKHGKGKK